jgi:AcrR family transcriptional regulator
VTTRSDRRRARTHQALVDAAIRVIAEGRADRTTIQELTDAADIGFGTFYNHFDSKDELLRAASAEVLEQWGRVIDTACAGTHDPAEVFAISLRMSGRLAWTHPTVARFITGAGLDLLDSPSGLGARALRDIKAAESAGRFTGPSAEIALSAVAGGLIGLLRLQQRAPEQVDVASVDALTEAVLRLLGIDAADAHALAWTPLPRSA